MPANICKTSLRTDRLILTKEKGGAADKIAGAAEYRRLEVATSLASIGRHIHLDLDVDAERVFHYRSRGADGHRVVLHRGDTVTFTCNDDFSVRFTGASPFTTSVLYARHLFITSRVRGDAVEGPYAYTVEVVRGEESVFDPVPGQPGAAPPVIIIENAE